MFKKKCKCKEKRLVGVASYGILVTFETINGDKRTEMFTEIDQRSEKDALYNVAGRVHERFIRVGKNEFLDVNWYHASRYEVVTVADARQVLEEQE